MSRQYDVIIVGGGPAGSTAGYLLSRAGLKVLIIDKSTFPRHKLCAGCITDKTIRLLERVFGETADSLKRNNIVNFESGRYEVFYKQTPLSQMTTGFRFLFVDRDIYDYYLLKKAMDAGAEFAGGDGIGLRSLDILRSSVTTVSGMTYSADIIIGADGVNSWIRRSFLVELFGREDWTDNLAAAHEIFLSRESSGKNFDHPALFFGYVDRGYAWIFPNRERLKIGICALKKGRTDDVLASFRTFLSDAGLDRAAGEKIHSYVLPYGCFLPLPTFRNVMLVGDAAGFADPLLGEGIFYAQRSAELASHAILEAIAGNSIKTAPGRITDAYVNLLRQYIYPEFVYAEKIRNFIFSQLNKYNYFPLKILMKLSGQKPLETVHGLRSYKWFRKKA